MQLFGGGVRYLTEKDIVNPNLIAGSKDFTGSKWINISENVQKDKYLDFTAVCVNWAWGGISQYIAVNKGETFTASMYVKAKAGSTISWYINLPSDEAGYKQVDTNPTTKTISGTGNWQKTSITFTVTGDSGAIKPRIESADSSPYWIAGMKLERGTTATPWCPAPEDYAMNSDLDNKVNTDRNLYFLKEGTSPLTESEIFNTNDGQGRLQVIHQRMQTNGSDTFGDFDNLLLFGGDDITSIFDVNTFQNQVKVSAGGAQGKANWSEDIAWKSDIQRLEQEISDLQKQVLSRSITHIVDDKFDMNSAEPGTYRSWGTKPINAPSNAAAWAKYFVIPFIEGDSSSLFQIAIDTNGNMFVRAKGGNPATWISWHKVNLGE